jgi:hypothetical protein
LSPDTEASTPLGVVEAAEVAAEDFGMFLDIRCSLTIEMCDKF